MLQFVIDPGTEPGGALSAAAGILREGGVVAYPTDTLYGLAVNPRSEEAVRRLFRLKGRAAEAAIPLIAADVSQAEEAGTFGPAEMRLAVSFWPGPLTIVVPADRGLSRSLAGPRGTVGVRVPAHPLARALAAAFGGCISSTSANRSGEPPAMTAGQVVAGLGETLDVLLDGGPAPGGPPSTIVEMVNGVPTLHRAGAVAWERVLESLE